MKRRTLSQSKKGLIAGKQNYKCANKPGNKLNRFTDYSCPFWKLNEGSFDHSGYEIDHINEFCESGDDDESNLQALCPCCHRVKTRSFMSERAKNRKCTKSKTDMDKPDNLGDKDIDDKDIYNESDENNNFNNGSDKCSDVNDCLDKSNDINDCSDKECNHNYSCEDNNNKEPVTESIMLSEKSWKSRLRGLMW
jgi:hypothetical protein